MLRSKILQMRQEHPEQKIYIVCRLRNFENAFVYLFIPERDSQRQFLCDEINSCQTHRELLQKTAQHEKQRLGCFDFALKLETLMERLRRPNQFEQSIGSSVGALPHADCFGAKSRPKLLLIQRRKLTQRMNSPFVQDGEDFLHLHLPFHAGKLHQGVEYVQVNISENLHRTFRQRLHKRAAVGFGHDAVVEDDNDAAIGLGPDQTAYPLSQFQNRFRQRKFSKRIATALLDQLKFRFYERMIRDGKRQSRDNHI